MDFYSGIAVGISIASAAGVYVSPLINDRIKRKRDNREMHKQQLVNHVLKPLINQIGQFLFQEITIREDQVFEKIPEERLKKYVERKFDFVGFEPIYTPLEEIGTSKNEWFDSDLFLDICNHFPNLTTEIENSRELVAMLMPVYVKRRWGLIEHLYERLNPHLSALADRDNELSPNRKAGISTGEDILRAKTYTNTGVSVALFQLLLYPKQQFPNLYETANKVEGLIDTVLCAIEEVPIKNKANEITEMQKSIVGSLKSLRNHLNKEATSGKTLPRGCHYLGNKSQN